MLRKIVEINDELCNGCGDCVPNCAEGALQIIDGKARMISDLFCDGLGACLGHCPTGALKVIEREAEPYDEWRVMERIVQGGENVIAAHLKHLEDHGELGFLKTALDYLEVFAIPLPAAAKKKASVPSVGGFTGCPGSAAARFAVKPASAPVPEKPEDFSELTHWPVQLHLINPEAGYYKNTDLLLAADCTAFAAGNFHSTYLKGRSLAIACPKLDGGRDVYVQKISALLERGELRSMTVLMMEVPCCGGLLQIVKEAMKTSTVKVPVKAVVLNLQGEKIGEHAVT
jgi:NAD-dependent dihydropyrimidine dehydrogenase PreA subunit